MTLYQVRVNKRFFKIYLSDFSNKYFFRKRQSGAKSGEQTSKTPTEFHLKNSTHPTPKTTNHNSPQKSKNTIILIKGLSTFKFLKDKTFQ